ncbi:MAG TPA: condensation domain-containing protein [Pyrinomonadaceae bacterium]|jgi:hypothetical protein|nr:condensation domain-containing protein [Pyrinomonadaceae bacterium]
MSGLAEAVAGLSPAQRAALERRLGERRAGAGAGGARVPRRAAGRDSFPLSFGQQRLWFLHQMEPGGAAYNIPNAVRLRGPFNAAALEQSLGEVRRRHEALRTTFAVEAGEPVQVVAPPALAGLPVVDLGGLPVAEREALARRLADAEAARPFDLEREPPLRATLLRLGPEEHVVLLTMHHIASDDWSVGLLSREVTTLYEAFSQGRPSPLAELPIQYADFALWQRGWLDGGVLEGQLAFWRRHLSGAPPLLDLAGDRQRPARLSPRGALAPVRLPKELSDQLRALSRAEGVTLFMTLLAAFQVMLHYATGQTDLVVGTDVANRRRSETERLIGFFVNQLVLRTDLSGDPTFRELLGRVREVTLGAYAHQDLPFERLVEELNPERSLAHAPLFQVKLILNNAHAGAHALPQLEAGSMTAERTTAQLDMTVPLWDTPEGIGGWINYSTDIFDASGAARIAALFEEAVRAAAESPGSRLSELRALLAGADRRRREEKGAEFAQASRQALKQARRRTIGTPPVR